MTQRAIDGSYIYFVTTNTTFHRKFLLSPEKAALLSRIIRNGCRLKHFKLLGYAILPDHFHLLVKNENFDVRGTRRNGHSLSDLMHSIKRNFSRQINSGRFWKSRFNFRIIEDEGRFLNTVQYMQFNFSKHGCPEHFGYKPFMEINWEAVGEL